MKMLIFDDRQDAARAVVDTIADQIGRKADSVLGLATGRTMEPVYRDLVERRRRGDVSLSEVITFNLDEYVGLAPGHPQSYRATMQRLLFDHVDIDPARTHLPRGDARDPVAEADRYEQSVTKAGGIDLQLLGLGANGHIGFNEPSSSLASRTRVKKLAARTRADNRRDFGAGETMPTHAITMGVGTIMRSAAIVLIAFGAGKAQAVGDMVEGPVTAMCPATALQFHPDVTVVLDAEAAARLSLRDVYLDIHPSGREAEIG